VIPTLPSFLLSATLAAAGVAGTAADVGIVDSAGRSAFRPALECTIV